MSNLKPSITILVAYVIIILGIANIDDFQTSIINFSPVFFVLIALAISLELLVTDNLIKHGVRISRYAFIAFWAIVYMFLWIYYWKNSLPVQVQIIQFILLEIAAGLAYDVGKQVGQIDNAFDVLSSSAYPNRMRDIQAAQDLIEGETARSRRYHHPLSVLALQLNKGGADRKNYELLEHDILERFANAKVGQILSDLARSTDLILRDKDEQFVILCPETDLQKIEFLSKRICLTIEELTGLRATYGVAAFPDEAVTFEDLLHIARDRSKQLLLSKLVEKNEEVVE